MPDDGFVYVALECEKLLFHVCGRDDKIVRFVEPHNYAALQKQSNPNRATATAIESTAFLWRGSAHTQKIATIGPKCLNGKPKIYTHE